MSAAPKPAPEPTPDRAEELVFRCLESDDPEGELSAVEGEDPELVATARELLASLASDGLLRPRTTAIGLPESLGPYRLLETLGEGGMGLVVAAHDTALDRRVAVKLIRPDMLPFAKSQQRFENEIQALARLEHPGIARVLQAGEEGGLRYYAMELVDGETLAQILARLRGREPPTLGGRDLFAGRLEPVDPATSERTLLLAASWVDACVRIVRDTALALAHAHDSGILHRDVKPGNVMLGRDGRVRLLDFGLARANDAQTITRSGAAIGSLAYMAPEQVLGERDAIDARSDVYALGVVLYELLTLQSPFLVIDSVEATQQRILRGRPPNLRRLNRLIAPELARVCMRATARQPSARHQTAAQLAGELSALLAEQPLATGSPIQRLVLAHPRATAWFTIAALASALGAAGAYLAADGRSQAHRTARAELTDAVKAAENALVRTRLQAYGALLENAQHELASHRLDAARDRLESAPIEERCWVWSHLRSRTKFDARLYRVPMVTSGAWKIAAGADRIAFTYSAGQIFGTIDPATGEAREARHRLDPRRAVGWFAADASAYAALPQGDPTKLVICDLTRETRRTLALARDCVDVRLNENGSRAALRTTAGGGIVLDTETGATLASIEPETHPWIDAEISPDGTLLATATGAGELFVWTVADGSLQWHTNLRGGSSSWITWSPDGRDLWTVSMYRYFECWRASDGARTTLVEPNLTTTAAERTHVRYLVPEPDGRHVWTTAWGGSLRCLHVPSERWVATVPAFSLRREQHAYVGGMTIDRHRSQILVSNRRKEIWAHDLERARSGALHAGEGHVRPAMNGRGDLFVVSDQGAPTLRRAGESASESLSLPPAFRAQFVRDDLVVVAPTDTGDLLLYDLAAAAVAGHLKGHRQPVRSLARLRGDRLLSGSEDGTVRLWDVDSRESLQTFAGHRRAVTEIAPSPTGEAFLTVSFDGSARLHPVDGSSARDLLRGADKLYTAAISPDGRWLATGGKAVGARLIDLRDDEPTAERLGTRPVTAIAFTPDGRRLILASHKANVLEVYDVASRRHVVTLGPNHGDRLLHASFAPDGKTLLTSDYGGLVRIWTVGK